MTSPRPLLSLPSRLRWTNTRAIAPLAGPDRRTPAASASSAQALANKPVALLTARELSAWRDALLRAGMKPATFVRLRRAVNAALSLAARRDHAIENSAAWTDGLSGVAEDFASRNIDRLDDDQVRAVIAECMRSIATLASMSRSPPRPERDRRRFPAC